MSDQRAGLRACKLALIISSSRWAFSGLPGQAGLAFFALNPPDPSAPNQSAPISLPRVRELFSRPDRLAGSDFLRREVSGRMFERLELIRADPAAVLDAGCGEGADLPVLQQRFPQARLIGLDAAPAMLAAARERHAQARTSMGRLLGRLLPRAGGRNGHAARPGQAELLCADFARLPLPAASLGLVWSNLALHWHPQPDRVFAEWHRALANDGLLMFSCFGPDTFRELRHAGWPQVLPFVDMHDLGDMLVHAGFATPVADMEMLTLTYADVDALVADVRALGGNPLQDRRRGLGARLRRQQLQQALEQGRNAEGRFALTVEVIYGHAFKPQPRSTSSGEAIVRFQPRRDSRPK